MNMACSGSSRRTSAPRCRGFPGGTKVRQHRKRLRMTAKAALPLYCCSRFTPLLRTTHGISRGITRETPRRTNVLDGAAGRPKQSRVGRWFYRRPITKREAIREGPKHFVLLRSERRALTCYSTLLPETTSVHIACCSSPRPIFPVFPLPHL